MDRPELERLKERMRRLVGKVEVIGSHQNIANDFNLNDGTYRANDWGRPKPSGYPENELMPWLNSDIKNMAYYYVYPAFTNIVEKGEMKWCAKQAWLNL